nr:helix-turn-helix domain-containing protein [Ardenticatena sp.]
MHSPFHAIPSEERGRIQHAFHTFPQWDILAALAASPMAGMSVGMLAQYTARQPEQTQRALETLVACGAVEPFIEDGETICYRLTTDEVTRQLILHILAACTDWAYRKRLVQWILRQREPNSQKEASRGTS